MAPKVTMIMVMSLDGIILRKENEDVTKWTSKEDQTFFKNVLRNFDAIITGRKSFFGKVVDVPYFVLTKKPEAYVNEDGVSYIKGTPAEIIKKVKNNKIKNIALLGGTEVNHQFLKNDLVNEILLTVEPLFLGKCKHITLEEELNVKLELINFHKINKKGTMLFHYKIVNKKQNDFIYENYLDIVPQKADSFNKKNLSQINKKFWDERASIHNNSEFYRTQELINGKSSLLNYEFNELGDVKGKEIIHLQCHIATESISLSRLGAKVTAVDYSNSSIKVAEDLAKKCNANINFICSDVFDILGKLKNKKFDIVYVNFGALIFLNDLEKWGFIVQKLLKKNGFLYLNELHPVAATLSDYEPKIIYNYFDRSPKIWNESGSYADGIDKRVNSTTKNNYLAVWNWTLGDIVNAIAKQNLKIEFLNEHAAHVDKRFFYLEKGADNLWNTPNEIPDFPATFSLKATKMEN